MSTIEFRRLDRRNGDRQGLPRPSPRPRVGRRAILPGPPSPVRRRPAREGERDETQRPDPPPPAAAAARPRRGGRQRPAAPGHDLRPARAGGGPAVLGVDAPRGPGDPPRHRRADRGEEPPLRRGRALAVRVDREELRPLPAAGPRPHGDGRHRGRRGLGPADRPHPLPGAAGAPPADHHGRDLRGRLLPRRLRGRLRGPHPARRGHVPRPRPPPHGRPRRGLRRGQRRLRGQLRDHLRRPGAGRHVRERGPDPRPGGDGQPGGQPLLHGGLGPPHHRCRDLGHRENRRAAPGPLHRAPRPRAAGGARAPGASRPPPGGAGPRLRWWRCWPS